MGLLIVVVRGSTDLEQHCAYRNVLDEVQLLEHGLDMPVRVSLETFAVCAIVASMSANAFTLAILANHGTLTRAMGILAVTFILIAGICVVMALVISTWFGDKN